jgi:hypothetical protein
VRLLCAHFVVGASCAVNFHMLAQITRRNTNVLGALHRNWVRAYIINIDWQCNITAVQRNLRKKYQSI